MTLGLSDKQTNINVSPKDIKVYTALANILREYPDSYQEAYELTQRAVQHEPQWEEAHNMMGNCLMKLERFREARDAFKKSVSFVFKTILLTNDTSCITVYTCMCLFCLINVCCNSHLNDVYNACSPITNLTCGTHSGIHY